MIITEKQKGLLILTVIYSGMWMVYYLSEIIMGRIKGADSLLMNLIPILFFILVAAGFWLMYQINRNGIKVKSIVFAVIIFVIIDQAVKYLIRSSFSTVTSIDIIPGWAYISPVLNTKGSWAASRYGLELGMGVFILLNIIVVPIIIQGYRFFNYKNGKSFWVDLFFILALSGCLCSLIDKSFFGGSLDFLNIGDLFVADLKDFYLTLSIGCMMAEVFLKPDLKTTLNSSTKDDLNLLKEFISFSFSTKKN